MNEEGRRQAKASLRSQRSASVWNGECRRQDAAGCGRDDRAPLMSLRIGASNVRTVFFVFFVIFCGHFKSFFKDDELRAFSRPADRGKLRLNVR